MDVIRHGQQVALRAGSFGKSLEIETLAESSSALLKIGRVRRAVSR